MDRKKQIPYQLITLIALLYMLITIGIPVMKAGYTHAADRVRYHDNTK